MLNLQYTQDSEAGPGGDDSLEGLRRTSCVLSIDISIGCLCGFLEALPDCDRPQTLTPVSRRNHLNMSIPRFYLASAKRCHFFKTACFSHEFYIEFLEG